MRPLAEELKTYEENLVLLPNGEEFDLCVGNFICDAPGRSLVTGTAFYNGTNGCGKCEVTGVFDTKMLFLKEDAPLRTGINFRNRKQVLHHREKSPLEDLKIDMVKQFPLDYMHLVCLGITKLLLRLWFRSKKPLLSPKILDILSDELLELGKYLPKEFNRKTHSITELGRWKATVLRTFLLYLGIIVLRRHLEKKYIDNFTLLSCAIRILCDPVECINNNLTAKNLLKQFLGGFKTFIQIFI